MLTHTFYLFLVSFCLSYLTLEIRSNILHTKNDQQEFFSNIDNEDNIWEESGFFEGDIILSAEKQLSRNGMLNETYYWPNSIVPFKIDEHDFSEYTKNR